MSDFLVGKFKSLEAAQSLKVGSKTVTNLIDSAAVTQIAPSGGIDSAVASGLIDSAFLAKNTNNLSEGENLYYTKGRSDSDFNANFNLNNSLLTADRLNEGETNLFYTDDRVRVVSLDSQETIQLIDSAYIQARQSTVGTGGLDSSSTIALIDSAYVQARSSGGSSTLAGLTDVTVTNADPTYTQNPSSGKGTLWINDSTGEAWVLTDATTNDNVWTNIGDGAGAVSSFEATGGTKVTAGTYTYHTFTTSTNFTVTQGNNKQIEYAIIAGAGGGGSRHGGGGGAGGFRTGTATVSQGVYTVIVGAGGDGGVKDTSAATNGSNSSAFGITSIGGGKGGDYVYNAVGNGGSGGGAGNTASSSYNTGGSGTTGQGNDGGDITQNGANWAGAGGGGADSDGGNASNTATSGGKGGDGKQTLALWAVPTGTGDSDGAGDSGWFAGGGGGGGTMNSNTGGGAGKGGGAPGMFSSTAAAAGTINTGGGGGGSRDGHGGNGGSGIIIVRYT